MRTKAMIRRAIVLAMLACVATLYSEGKADPRVAKALDRLGLKYSATSEGNYSLVYDLDGGRRQTVYIMSRTEKYDGLEIREIWSNAGTLCDKPSYAEMLKLLEDNNTEKMGAWSLEADDDGCYLAYFAIRVPIDMKDSDLSSMMEFAAAVADEMEASLFGPDYDYDGTEPDSDPPSANAKVSSL